MLYILYNEKIPYIKRLSGTRNKYEQSLWIQSLYYTGTSRLILFGASFFTQIFLYDVLLEPFDLNSTA
jgi:hypothetical protein